MIKITALALALVFYLPMTALAEEIILDLVSQNLNRLFDDRDDGLNEKILSQQQYQRRLNRVVTRIAGNWHLPDVIAVQEVENRRILADISAGVQRQSPVKYQPLLIEGNDRSGIDVGYLVKADYRLERIEALFKNMRWKQPSSRLFSRPPLRIDICAETCVTIVNIHLRSMRGIASGSRAKYVRQKRHRQAQTLARWINRFQQRNPQRPLLVVGDFNALTPSDRHVDVVGIIRGNPDQHRPRLKSSDLIEVDLIDASAGLAPSQRVSYRFHKKNQQLDYLLASHQLANSIRKFSFGKIDYRFSDHAALQASIALPQ